MMPNPNPIDVLITIPFPDPLVEQLQAVSPRLRITVRPARRAEDIPADLWNRTEILLTESVLPEPEQVHNLHWLQLYFAGIDFALNSPLLKNQDILVTTLSGAAAPQAAEFIMLMMMTLGHRLTDLLANQAKAEWPRDRWERFAPRELRASTVGILGYGSIGRELSRLLQPYNVSVLAAKRDVMHPQDLGYTPEGLGDPDGLLFRRLYPIQAVLSLIKSCDFIVVALPLTDATRNLIDKEEFDVMKSGAFLIDISRGGIVNHQALLQSLQERHLGGAALDVFPEEPLPPTSPLWKLPNVIVTPHIAGVSALYRERAAAMFAENLRRYVEGEPLLNRFDSNRGY
jgi:phosphoglycerate dehydrogenase-like enzyme